jgi:NADPH-dependent ferric siderophore reductase
MIVDFHVQARMPQAAAFLVWLQEHLQAEGVQVQRTAQGLQLHMPQIGSLAFHRCSDEGFDGDIAAADARMAALIQLSLEEHAQEFLHARGAPANALQLNWRGLPTSDLQHRFQVVKVIGVHDLTPHMRRVRLAVPVIDAFAGDGLHVRLVLPIPGCAPIWPHTDAQGRLVWNAGQTPLPQRIYTIRQCSTAQGWLEIDIVRHAHQAPGAQWISQVKLGDAVGLLGPAGGSVPDAARLHLVADMAALPAALRIAQAQAARGGRWQLLALGSDARDAAYAPASAHVHVQWHIGTPQSHITVVDAWLRQQATDAQPHTVWLAGSQQLVHAVRAALRAAPIPGLEQPKLAAYWK